MPDPRVTRTKIHVLTVARRLLVERNGSLMTISALSQTAEVSRKTIHAHWGTIENVIAEAIAPRPEAAADTAHLAGLPLRERLELFLDEVRASIADPLTAMALLSMMQRATQDDDARASLLTMSRKRLAHFHERVGRIAPEQYNEIVGPIYSAQFVTGQTISDAGLRSLVDTGMRQLQTLEQVGGATT